MFQAYTDLILRDRPSLYWRAEEASGTAIGDLTPNRRDGTLAGGVILGQDGALAFDRSSALDLDGVDGVVSSSYAPFIDDTVRTFEGWASRDTSSTFHVIVRGDGGAAAPTLYLDSGSNDVAHQVRDNDGGATSLAEWADTWPGNGVWTHWALILDRSAATAELFINGGSQGVEAGLTQTYSAPGNFGLSGSASIGFDFDGKMDEIAVYERALTPAEILAHYKAGAKIYG